MFIEFKQLQSTYTRLSKLGLIHEYNRVKIVCIFRCDQCSVMFERPMSKIEPKRRSNAYFHVCGNCDNKKFAQKKGAERRTIWDRPASSADDISKL